MMSIKTNYYKKTLGINILLIIKKKIVLYDDNDNNDDDVDFFSFIHNYDFLQR